MNNLILDYRPKCFDDILGQEIAVKQIKTNLQELLSNFDSIEKIQPIILSGPRGTGKTTTGRLIAMYLNCQKPEDKKDFKTTCDCSYCTSIITNPENVIDYIELDGAKNNGVAEIESVIETTFYAPINKFKIILIDECHMLSKAAWNSLLKQLEEPPKNVVYLLATTEEEKIIPTVKSRCKIRRFSLVEKEILYKFIEDTIKNDFIEKYPNLGNPEILNNLVESGKGSIRDVLTNLGNILDLGNDGINSINVSQATSNADITNIGKLVYTVLEEKSPSDTILHIDKLEKSGIQCKEVIEMIQLILCDLLNVKNKVDIVKVLGLKYYQERFLNVKEFEILYLLGIILQTAGSIYTFTYPALYYTLLKYFNEGKRETSVDLQKPNLHHKGSNVPNTKQKAYFSAFNTGSEQTKLTGADKLHAVLSKTNLSDSVTTTEDEEDDF